MKCRFALAIAAFAAVAWIALASSAVTAEPVVSVTPDEGPLGTPLTISGQGFEPQETVFIEILPDGAPHPYRIGNVTTDSAGSFATSAALGVVYLGPPFPDPAPPGQGEQVNLAPGAFQIIAYPESFQTPVSEAPGVAFQVTASSLPDTGGPPIAPGRDSFPGVLVGMLLVVFGLSTFLALRPRRQ